MKVIAQTLLNSVPDDNYNNDFIEGMDPRYAHQYPIFNFLTVESMLLDSRVQFALGLIKGPIHTYTKFFSSEDAENPQIQQAIVDRDYFFSYKVEAEDKETEQYILKQFNRFWEVASVKALTALEWGYSGSQVMYQQDSKGVIHFDNLHNYHPRRVRPVSQKGHLIGMVYRSNLTSIHRFFPVPKAFWHVHRREINKYTGRSRLKGSHIPWHEMWTQGGARDIRRLWFYKNSYNGGIMRYPEGQKQKDIDGTEIEAMALAERLISQMVTGGFLILPNKKQGGEGKDYAWDYEPPQSNVTPQGLMEYPTQLRSEILEGMGIPPEVVESSGSQGFGSATGRKVPYMGFIASLYPLVGCLIGDFRAQIMDNLLLFRNKGKKVEYDITPIVPLSPEMGAGSDQITGVESNTGMND